MDPLTDQTKRAIYKARDPEGKLHVAFGGPPRTFAEAVVHFREKWPGQAFQCRYEEIDWVDIPAE